MRIRRNGFTLVELLVTLIISSIIILMIGSISSVSQGSYLKTRNEIGVYNDIFYGIDLMNHAVRNGLSVSVDNGAHTLTAGGLVFQQQGTDLIYTENGSSYINYILKDVNNLVFVPVKNNKLITIDLKGEKTIDGSGHKVVFDFSVSNNNPIQILGRN